MYSTRPVKESMGQETNPAMERPVQSPVLNIIETQTKIVFEGSDFQNRKLLGNCCSPDTWRNIHLNVIQDLHKTHSPQRKSNDKG